MDEGVSDLSPGRDADLIDLAHIRSRMFRSDIVLHVSATKGGLLRACETRVRSRNSFRGQAVPQIR